MLNYIVRRLLLIFPTLIGVLAVVFFVMALAPGGVGGGTLDIEGNQNQNEDAQAIRRQIERRYNLDKPLPVQFARWLNQVSPVGFRMSSDLELGEAEVASLDAVLAELPVGERERERDALVRLVGSVAAYRGVSGEEAAADLVALLRDREGVVSDPAVLDAALGWVDSTMEASSQERARQEIAAAYERSERAGQRRVVRVLGGEAAGVSRVRLDRPAVKVPDLGLTMQGRPVSERIAGTLPITVLLNLLSLPLIYVIAIGTGVYAARRAGGVFDVGSGFVLIMLWSLPVIWVGMLGITQLASEQRLSLFPVTGLHSQGADAMPFLPRFGGPEGFERGWLLDALWHLVLPVVCLTYGGFAVASRVMRGALLESLTADYVRTARAKGVAEPTVLWAHAFRNSMLPMITMVAGILPGMLAGSVVVENIFSINGMGNLAIEAAVGKDRELLMAITLIGGVVGLLTELIRDVCYAVADPRVSYD